MISLSGFGSKLINLPSAVSAQNRGIEAPGHQYSYLSVMTFQLPAVTAVARMARMARMEFDVRFG
jgi:hypothetical protein